MKRLFKRDFTMVAIGQVISLFGNAILRFALPLYLLRETDSSSLFGIVTACSFIPMIIFSLLGGVIADRKNKRNIMVILDFATAGVIFLFYLALGKIPVVPLMVLTLMILYGISGTYQPAVQASVPLLTERKRRDKYGEYAFGIIGTCCWRRAVRVFRFVAHTFYKHWLFCFVSGYGDIYTYPL